MKDVVLSLEASTARMGRRGAILGGVSLCRYNRASQIGAEHGISLFSRTPQDFAQPKIFKPTHPVVRG